MRSGTVLAGKYRLLAPIAEGGMGAVWRAVDLHLGSPVAIKLIHQRDVNNAEMLARFEAEAEIAAQLRSAHVVQVFDAGVDRDSGVPFIAMELLDGESLRDRLERSGPLPPAAVVEVISQVGRALTRAHQLGIIHRDLKPANVFLQRDADRDVVKVLDFGIAKRMHGLRAGPTVTGDLLGTPTYMSPEQILSSKEVSYRTDLWSLAVITVECLTGKLPFDSDNLPGLALLICHGQATLPSQLGAVPAGFDAWFQKATQLNPAERFASATILVEELRVVCEGRPPPVHEPVVNREEQTHARPEPPGQRGLPTVGPTTTTVPRAPSPPRRQRQRRMAVLLAAGAVLLAVTGTALRRDDAGPALAEPVPPERHAAAGGMKPGGTEGVEPAPSTEPPPSAEPSPSTEPAGDPTGPAEGVTVERSSAPGEPAGVAVVQDVSAAPASSMAPAKGRPKPRQPAASRRQAPAAGEPSGDLSELGF